MGGASRLILLLTTPFSLLHPRSRTSVFRFARHSRLSLATTCHPTTTISLIPIKASQQIHTQTTNKLKDDHHFGDSFSSELYNLIHTLSAAGYSGGYENHPDDAYAYLQLQNSSQEFLRLANACLTFARNQPNILGNLSRKDIQVIVENGTPFLFKSALDNARRMRSFLHSAGTNVLESDKAQTVDLMKYLLSYASNPTSESNNLYCREIVQSSVRNLMRELVEISSRVPVSDLCTPAHRGVSGSYGHPPRPFGQNIEMKRGDWICPKCSFMNFARNVKCIECEETRPKRQVTSGEWECPQCDFYNYGRNMVCLRCDCKRPGEASFGTTVNSMPDFGHINGDYANKAAVDRRLDANKEKAQQWFSKVSQKLKNVSALSGSAVVEEDFPEILSSRKGGNRFVVSPRKTPLETRVSNSDYQTNLGNDGMPEDDSYQTGGANKTPLDESVNRSLDQIFGHASSVSGTNINNSETTGQNDAIMNSTPPARYGIPKGSNSSHVPFVPLPANMFAKKLTTEEDSVNEVEVTKSRESVSSITRGQTDTVSAKDKSEEPASLDKDRGEEAIKPERWFKRVAELHHDDVKDLENAISDEDFPEIMPIRKGENRFVISSKKKDRSLTSSMYKPEQPSNTKFVPFVPFPPNYFAKNEKQLSDGPDSSVKSIDETSSGSSRHPEESRIGAANNINYVQNRENQERGTGNWSSKFSVDFGEPSNAIPPQNSFSSQTGPVISGNPAQNFPTSQTSRSNDSWGGSRNLSWKGKSSQSWEPPSGENSQTMSYINSSSSSGSGRYSGTEKKLAGSPPEKQQINSSTSSSGWMGKSSLEGSAVKEPDPLDMSEEAKAERWFRRVAQIKDISELSQIPDEDFPSIMPMRKGVNRFVVSKRKTPLERRLTSPQYRRNLPVVSSSDPPPPVNKEND